MDRTIQTLEEIAQSCNLPLEQLREAYKLFDQSKLVALGSSTLWEATIKSLNQADLTRLGIETRDRIMFAFLFLYVDSTYLKV